MRPANLQVSFADLEFIRQGIHLEPTLKAIADFLDDHRAVVQRVRRDLTRGLKRPATGRTGLTAQQVLRSLILMRVKNWDYRELRERIADGCTLRHFTDFYSQRVPKHDAFNRAVNRLTPDTLQAVNDAVIHAAVRLGLEDGTKLRVDTTVVETDIHHPTDNTLLWDSVRVLTRLVRKLDTMLPAGVGAFTNRTRSARRRMQEIQRMTARERPRQQVRKYRALISVTAQVVTEARAVVQRTVRVRGCDLITQVAVDALRGEIARHCELGTRVVSQASRRVLHGEQVPTDEKLYSIFETHTDLIKRGKVLRPVEFGQKVFLAESGRGLITQYRVLRGNPADQVHVKPSLDRHQALFDAVPRLYSSDRGFFNEENIHRCQTAGVGLTCIPQSGGQRSAKRESLEKSRAFKRGQRFRAGIEGRISVLFRGRGMKRALVEGRDHFELFVGAAVLANNLLVIAELLRRKPARRRRPAA
ncbi:MAG: ISNCY family transposase [Acidobacteria bacterium]|nr:ISNCY family transposase [Acidobacteriota bacterium]